MYQFSLNPINVEKITTKYRNIVTQIPNPKTLSIINLCLQSEPLSMNDQLPVVWHKAEDFQIYDVSGNKWIDFTSTIFVANIGHSHPKVCEAIIKTVSDKLLNAYYYQTELRAKLVNILIEITPGALNKVLLLSTGSEATEAALKMLRLYGANLHPEKTLIIAFEGAFHGKTMGSQTLGGKLGGKKWIKYVHPEIFHLPYPYPWVLEEKNMSGEEFFYESLKNLKNSGVDLSNIAGFYAEPYQGWCAVFFPKDYMQALRKWCDQNNSLLGFDEVQAGFGRTGKLFGFEHFEVEPDIIWCGKALSSSIPVSAVIGRKELIDIDASLNSTHGGNPIGAAASHAAIKVLLEDNMVFESSRKGKIIEKELHQWQSEKPGIVCEIFGAGMVWAVFIRNPFSKELDIELVDRIIEKSMQKGLLSIRTCCGTIKLGPPLSIQDDALIEGIHVLKESLNDILKEGYVT
ncbi:aspartate aminotransferase family protein [Fluviispira sanaruensis]|uniref:Aspartate aminotransferase family protein n=1 Tax=Fluviispira sanaruensis TaxID=2493639 RepID=A0A4P2VQ53_FLUSA|nr:aspartate aminotransferase family protein [Fluviispira sanaruensis]BBH54089.1 aspartate aminotransferase family protein [Fluviispira sanaruensis]